MTGAGTAAPPAERRRETALYPPVKAFLEAQGFRVKGEICGCDVVAVQDGEPPILVIAELKLSFTLELVLQAVDRLRGADSLYLAIVASRRGRDRDLRVTRLCRLLGVGLLAVDLTRGHVAVLCEPSAYRPRPNLPLRRRLLREHDRRRGDPSAGGSSRQPIMTAYRQRALACVCAIGHATARPRDLRDLAEDAGAILLRNVYGWFERERPGHYRLSDRGREIFAAAAVPPGSSDAG
ncbi:DUF2161 family putative PD-(D/E)XK-type phosphodiesterase [Sphingomonas abaci]|uniref:DUF2161 domain-containing phosphodiesterase n=1 Tax=Sphingomonas abaci TaxID=237611 RepID=A0A7W7AHR8_9SPHN|nr:DUF2161 family putative PD-(D/E)XK-type phosphodiesterase [Sphingomonas abaci]MBB4617242.1 hypothetical protein [Sphingomonas abaci]